MELHRSRPKFHVLALSFVAGIFIIWSSQTGWELRFLFIPLGSTALLIFGLLVLAVAIGGTVRAVRVVTGPTPIKIDETGLRLHVAGINRFVPWAAVESVVLEPGSATSGQDPIPQLVLVPAPGADLGVAVKYQNTVNGRPSVVLLPLDAIVGPNAEIIEVFQRYAGQRFIDGTLTREPGTADA